MAKSKLQLETARQTEQSIVAIKGQNAEEIFLGLPLLLKRKLYLI
jgi:hypothetical protein